MASDDIRETAGLLSGAGRRFGIVASRFNGRLVESLLSSAIDCLERHGTARNDIQVARVPGAWEIPLALNALAEGAAVDGLIALGIVIRGETPHFDYICSRAAQGAAGVEERHGIPVGFGILTCESSQQAAERAGGKAGNKGWEAASAALEMVDLLARLRS